MNPRIRETRVTLPKVQVSEVAKQSRCEASEPRVDAEFSLGHHHRSHDRDDDTNDPVEARNLEGSISTEAGEGGGANVPAREREPGPDLPPAHHP